MTITGIIAWCIFGLIVGALARLIMPGVQAMGLLLTMVLGIVGSFIGGFIGSLFSGGGAQIQPASWIMSIIGALLLLFIAGRMKKTA